MDITSPSQQSEICLTPSFSTSHGPSERVPKMGSHKTLPNLFDKEVKYKNTICNWTKPYRLVATGFMRRGSRQ